MHLSHADHHSSPPRVEIPRDYNAAHDLLQRNAARPGKVAYIDATTGERLRPPTPPPATRPAAAAARRRRDRPLICGSPRRGCAIAPR